MLPRLIYSIASSEAIPRRHLTLRSLLIPLRDYSSKSAYDSTKPRVFGFPATQAYLYMDFSRYRQYRLIRRQGYIGTPHLTPILNILLDKSRTLRSINKPYNNVFLVSSSRLYTQYIESAVIEHQSLWLYQNFHFFALKQRFYQSFEKC